MTIHVHTSPFTFTPDQPKGRATARPFGDRARFIRRSHEIGTEIAISQHDHSRSHLTIHIHTSSAEGPGDRPALRRSHEIQTEIAISQHDHSRSHLAIHIHTSPAEGPGGRPALRRSHEIGTEVEISIQISRDLSTFQRLPQPSLAFRAPSRTFSRLLLCACAVRGGRYPRGSRAHSRPLCTSWTWPLACSSPRQVRWRRSCHSCPERSEC